MPKIAYITKNFRQEARDKISVANEIIAEYDALGMTLTLRQLYYQFVARDIIPNNQREYSKLSALMSDARLAGYTDWHALEDRTRFIRQTNHFKTPEEIIQAAANQFRMDKWADQDYHVEVLIEKDALVGVIEPVCRALDVTYASCRGYMSQSMMWESAMRLKQKAIKGKNLLVIHLGDHDPSGKQMSEDIEARLKLFLEKRAHLLEVNRIALNYDQIEQYNPPPNPAKLSDPRAAAYIDEFGDESWELDALDPKTIAALIRDAVKAVRDEDAWSQAVTIELGERKKMRAISENYISISEFVEDNNFIDDVADEEIEDEEEEE
jgi:hypothetical protein